MIDWETHDPLTTLTHLDGRNARKLVGLKPYFSEFAWMKSRLGVMGRYLEHSSRTVLKRALTASEKKNLYAISDTFSLSDVVAVQKIERTTNHDLKALELFFETRLKRSHLLRLIPYINLGIGSEDINSIALGQLLVGCRGDVLIPALARVAERLMHLTGAEKATAMIARTHAQPSSITTFGKECANALSRLCDEIEYFKGIPLSTKCSGEVGSYQAFAGVSASADWIRMTDAFVRSFDLVPSHASTQIAPYDSIVRYLQSVYRVNAILLDVCKNMWLYVLLGYLKVAKIDAEVGSAGMPHKVNPIFFEGAEGGFETANGIIELLVRKLPINRLQRDFSDSTTRRNLVLPVAYSLLSYQSLAEALDRIHVDRIAIARDLTAHAEVWTETIKAYGTMHGIPDMYDRLKAATRGMVLSRVQLHDVLMALPLGKGEKKEIMDLIDRGHNPYPSRIADAAVKRARKLFTF